MLLRCMCTSRQTPSVSSLAKVFLGAWRSFFDRKSRRTYMFHGLILYASGKEAVRKTTLRTKTVFKPLKFFTSPQLLKRSPERTLRPQPGCNRVGLRPYHHITFTHDSWGVRRSETSPPKMHSRGLEQRTSLLVQEACAHIGGDDSYRRT